jgi:hypothetical protein
MVTENLSFLKSYRYLSWAAFFKAFEIFFIALKNNLDEPFVV